jgi:hypothetical protein
VAEVMTDFRDIGAARRPVTDAEQIARAIPKSIHPEVLLGRIAAAMAYLGDVAASEQIAHRLTGGWPQFTFAEVAVAAAKRGDVYTAERIARTITEPKHQVRALTQAAEAAGRAGDTSRGRHLAADAEPIAYTIHHGGLFGDHSGRGPHSPNSPRPKSPADCQTKPNSASELSPAWGCVPGHWLGSRSAHRKRRNRTRPADSRRR